MFDKIKKDVLDRNILNALELGNTKKIREAFSAAISEDGTLALPEGVLTIPKNALSYNEDVQKLILPSTVTAVCDYACDNCISLNTVMLNDGLTYIGEGAFAYSGVTSITIPGSVDIITDFAFAYCDDLETVVLNEGTNSIGERAFMNTGINSIVIPSTVKEIGSTAFNCCRDLKQLTLAEGLERIGRGAFEYSRLESVDIPSTVQEIEDLAFYGYKKLAVAKIRNPETIVAPSAFEGNVSIIRGNETAPEM